MFVFIAIFVGALVLSYAARPKQAGQKPAGINEIQVPIAEEDKEIAVLFGTRDFTGPNCCWYGDLKTVAIKSSGSKK
jgi:hypothetical protein